MLAWTDFLRSRGASFEQHAVAKFGDPAAELEAARDAAVVCDLAPLSVLRVAGLDAPSFLQGQVTSDVEALPVLKSQYAAYCSPKGRILANFVLVRVDAQTFDLLLPAPLADPIRKRLAMFVLRAKVTLEHASAASARLGIGGPGASVAVQTALGAAPGPFESAAIGGGTIVALPGPRWIVFADPTRAAELWERLAAVARPAGFPVWAWLTIHAGVPVITEATQDQFVPQMANWDVLEGISFRKGCYTGQEIVARMQYLGRLKERTYLAHVDGPAPQPGERLYSAAFGDQACGTVVNAAPAPGGGADLLAVLQVAAAEGAVRIGAPDGVQAALRRLPYALPAAAPRGRIA